MKEGYKQLAKSLCFDQLYNNMRVTLQRKRLIWIQLDQEIYLSSILTAWRSENTKHQPLEMNPRDKSWNKKIK